MTWQPIETAPKDGTLLDLWLGNDEFPHRRTDCYWGTCIISDPPRDVVFGKAKYGKTCALAVCAAALRARAALVASPPSPPKGRE